MRNLEFKIEQLKRETDMLNHNLNCGFIRTTDNVTVQKVIKNNEDMIKYLKSILSDTVEENEKLKQEVSYYKNETYKLRNELSSQIKVNKRIANSKVASELTSSILK